MKTRTITESGMKFGPFNKDEFFHIEKSKIYRNIQENVKIAEFLLLKFGSGIDKKDLPTMNFLILFVK